MGPTNKTGSISPDVANPGFRSRRCLTVVGTKTASDQEIAHFIRTIGKIAREHGFVEPGYRLLANVGADGGQEVPHLHVHLFGGQKLGRMIA